MQRPSDHPAIPEAKIGVLLINLGTPSGTDYWSMRRYLKQFLSDRRIIEAPKLIWWPILNGIILTTRPKRSGAAYDKIWMKETDESPLRFHTRTQSDALGECLSGINVVVDWAMRYGEPTIASKIDRLRDEGCRKILLAALYPQYSAATMATAYDNAFDHLKSLRWQPAVRTLPAYHDDPTYIEAVSVSISRHLEGLDWEPEKILCSFHGLPKENLTKGDPYHCQCQKTARLVREKLGIGEDRFGIVFQSRFGPKEWLQPYADKTVESLAKGGMKRIAIVSPGFSVDCVETLEELAIGLRELFEENGGTHFSYIPCLNAEESGMSMLETLIRRELAGWV